MQPATPAPSRGIELHRTGSLVERALTRLSEGPLATAAIAREVLFLQGNPKAASAAVFALLGTDERVRVDAQGVWSLAGQPDSSIRPPRPLAKQRWVVVDVETTGGSIGYGHRVIEIGMVQVENGEIVGTYETLINPGRPVPRMITSLTGITQAMIDPAPAFAEVCGRISSELEGRTFVGHNVGFDWRFVSSEIERSTARALAGPRVCTLRIARRLLPHLRSRSLGSLAEYFGIPMDRHHRALDDAVATAHLMLRFVDMLGDRGINDWAQLQEFFRARPPRKRRRRRANFSSADAA